MPSTPARAADDTASPNEPALALSDDTTTKLARRPAAPAARRCGRTWRATVSTPSRSTVTISRVHSSVVSCSGSAMAAPMPCPVPVTIATRAVMPVLCSFMGNPPGRAVDPG
ncbi:hypothetical protein MHK71_04680 [Kocuria indica]|nr:hypothetical protein [Kocuria indica]MCG7431810.1 hypothetical protein [Kocuria indica]